VVPGGRQAKCAGQLERNFCTGMFLYLIKKSIEKGYINKEEFDPVVTKAYQGMIKSKNKLCGFG